MMQRYQCVDCKWDGDDPDQKQHRERHEYWGAMVYETYFVRCCPACGSEELDDAPEIEEVEEAELIAQPMEFVQAA